jgi:hypothetical protein
MGSLGMRLDHDPTAMGDAVKISPCVSSNCAQNAMITLLIIRDCKAICDAAKTSPRIASPCAQNAIIS